MLPSVLVNEFLSSLRIHSGATSAALLLHMEPVDRASIVLASYGDEVVPELENEDRAWQLILDWQESPSASMSSGVSVFPTENGDNLLVRVAFDNIMARPKAMRRDVNERRSQPNINTAPSIDGALWLGLVGCTEPDQLVSQLRSGLEDQPGSAPLEQFAKMQMIAAKLAWSNYQLSTALQDPVSQLPGRMNFQVFLKRAIAAAQQHQQSISLMLVNPDDFSMINHRYGREQGDLAVREIADTLAHCLRATDGVFRYGGAVFGVVLPATDLAQCKAAAEKVRKQLTNRGYLDDRERLTFSMGAVVTTPEDCKEQIIEAADMLKRADVSLNRAKLSGGGRVVVRAIHDDGGEGEGFNPLGGIFTADSEKDYRNMLLLWETVGLVSGSAEPTAMATALVNRLATGFQPDRIALFSVDKEETIEPIAVNVRDDSAREGRSNRSSLPLDESQNLLISQALASSQVESLRVDPETVNNSVNAYAVPLLARERTIGCLYLDGRGRRLILDSSDVIFLTALAGQMAVALDRAALAAGWIQEKDRESRQLREELQELRQSLDQSRMVYVSEEMKGLMDTLQRVAPTNATVLITGESGTGKEMLAHSIHEFSDRRERPFVVFDCGAVAHNLLEAELFGHVKGAFTGAERESEGRIAQADGGTLFLDELGELPLQVQSKLLRFVQEKEFSPVGSPHTVRVDVRLVAATNRTLQDEVAAGRFRADLYYRLQVISLQAIPLRHRQADVLPLANYYLERYATQYDKQVQLHDDARNKLLAYSWPGNVRELQNCILRTVLTVHSDYIRADDIELLSETPSHTTINLVVNDATEESMSIPGQSSPAADIDSPGAAQQQSGDDPWQTLRSELGRQVETALQHNSRRPLPLGRWLTEDLVLAANDASQKIVRRAAARVGIPETTFRRHFQKASSEQEAGLANRTADWESVREIIRNVIADSPDDNTRDVLDQARMLLLEDVQQQVAGRVSAGAALMGVTAPTYKRWLQEKH